MALLSTPKLKLVHQGLILVTIPLVFGFAFILILETVMQTYRDLRNQTISVSKISDRIYAINSRALMMQDCIASPLRFNADYLDVFSDHVSQELILLRTSLSQRDHSPSTRENLDVIDRDWSEFLQSKKRLNNPHRNEDMQAILRKLQLDLNNTAHQELSWHAKHNANAKEMDRINQGVLAVVLGLNILLCPMLVFDFSQNLAKRIRVLVDNSERFAEKRELLPAIKGSDEIAKLDQVFREMVREVRASEQAQRDFAAMVNHDIRTPLNALQATLTLISNGNYGSLSPDGIDKTKKAEHIVDELVTLVGQLLDLEGIKSGKLEVKLSSVELDEVVRKSVDTVYGFAEFKNVQIKVQKCSLFVLADESRLIQVATNLLANAVKYGTDGGRVEVSASELENGQIEVAVRDNGPGVPEESMRSLFEPFTRVQDESLSGVKGSGLGLFICRQIIEAHGGTIGVTAIETGGIKFWFRLRKAEQPAADPTSLGTAKV